MDRYEYNLLNRQATPVRHIETWNDQEDKEESFRRDDHYRPVQEVRYSDKRDDYDLNRNDRSRDYNDDHYDRDYSLGYNRRREDQRGDYEDCHWQGYHDNRRYIKKFHAKRP